MLKSVDLLLDFFGGWFVDLCFKRIVVIEIIEVIFDLLVDLLDEGVEFAFRDVPASTVDCFEFAAIDGDEFSPEQATFPTEKGKGTADLLDGFEVIPAKVSNGFAEGPGQGSQV